ncbi:type II toxin-antitoxin system RelE/ParE family toxin [Actinocatenispora sera]|uniref:DNA-binding protein n=1 Tax=Actinocatenispora sera TaxID=390989 RepID=A0A810L6G5_9ACTN|nr:type II toxin-antitoxin system RelE/ParE family toxin [Actinocatenispora sera]BCJ30222.1 hypothetical protein Asera_43300 [Actinocatenispora sera]
MSAGGEWEIYVVNEVREWLDARQHDVRLRVAAAIDLLAEHGPGLGRPAVDTLQASCLPNLKELRAGSIRVLFVFDPWRSIILLVAGDKAGQWTTWYRESIPLAEFRYDRYLYERRQEEGDVDE